MGLKQTHAPGPPVFLAGAFSYERGTPVLQENLNSRTAQQADFGDLVFFRTATDRELLLDQHRFLPRTTELTCFGGGECQDFPGKIEFPNGAA